MMKYIIHILLLLASCNILQAQRSRFVNSIAEVSPFRHKVISADSVYSFIKSDGFFEGFTYSNNIYILDETPINQKDVVENRAFTAFLGNIIHSAPVSRKTGFKEDTIEIGSIKRRYIASPIIPKEVYLDLFSAVIDSTTCYDKPITHFTASMFDDNFQQLLLFNGNYKVMRNFLAMPNDKYGSRNKYEKGYKNAKRELEKKTRPIRISVPVFDSTYNYAFVAVGRETPKINLLYRREEDGWKLLMAGNENSIQTHIDGMDF